jgi:hypothetical protein
MVGGGPLDPRSGTAFTLEFARERPSRSPISPPSIRLTPVRSLWEVSRRSGEVQLSDRALVQSNFRSLRALMHLIHVKNAGWNVPLYTGWF